MAAKTGSIPRDSHTKAGTSIMLSAAADYLLPRRKKFRFLEYRNHPPSIVPQPLGYRLMGTFGRTRPRQDGISIRRGMSKESRGFSTFKIPAASSAARRDLWNRPMSG